jgi:hypothetical protein
MSFCQLPVKDNWKTAQYEPEHCSPAVYDVTDTTICYDNVQKLPHLPVIIRIYQNPFPAEPQSCRRVYTKPPRAVETISDPSHFAYPLNTHTHTHVCVLFI